MKLDSPIGLLFNKRPDARTFQPDPSLPMSDKYIGIEIEAENIKYSNESLHRNLAYWTVTSDGSLRNYGSEFISVKLRGMDISNALSELSTFLDSAKIEPVYSERTSVHIHIDSRFLNVYQLKTLIKYYLACEPYYFSVIGKKREENIYCVPYYKNSNGLRNFSMLFQKNINEDYILRTVAEGLKYEAMNIRSIREKGSIEFRHHYGTHNKEIIYNWIINLLNLFKLSKESSEDEFTFMFGSMPYPDFLLNVVPKFTNVAPQELIVCESIARKSLMDLNLFANKSKSFEKEVSTHLPKTPIPRETRGDF